MCGVEPVRAWETSLGSSSRDTQDKSHLLLPDVVDLRWGLRISIYVKFPGNAVGIGPPLKIPDL